MDAANDSLPDADFAICRVCGGVSTIADAMVCEEQAKVQFDEPPQGVEVTFDEDGGGFRVMVRDRSWLAFWLCSLPIVVFTGLFSMMLMTEGNQLRRGDIWEGVTLIAVCLLPIFAIFGTLMLFAIFGRGDIRVRRNDDGGGTLRYRVGIGPVPFLWWQTEFNASTQVRLMGVRVPNVSKLQREIRLYTQPAPDAVGDAASNEKVFAFARNMENADARRYIAALLYEAIPAVDAGRPTAVHCPACDAEILPADVHPAEDTVRCAACGVESRLRVALAITRIAEAAARLPAIPGDTKSADAHRINEHSGEHPVKTRRYSAVLRVEPLSGGDGVKIVARQLNWGMLITTMVYGLISGGQMGFFVVRIWLNMRNLPQIPWSMTALASLIGVLVLYLLWCMVRTLLSRTEIRIRHRPPDDFGDHRVNAWDDGMPEVLGTLTWFSGLGRSGRTRSMTWDRDTLVELTTNTTSPNAKTWYGLRIRSSDRKQDWNLSRSVELPGNSLRIRLAAAIVTAMRQVADGHENARKNHTMSERFEF